VVDPAHRRNLVVQGCRDAERLDLDQGSRSTAANDSIFLRADLHRCACHRIIAGDAGPKSGG